MRKTRTHPPKDQKREDLRHYRRVIRDAVGALDVAGAPRWQDGVELTLAGRIRCLVTRHELTIAILRTAIAHSAIALDRSASSAIAVRAAAVAPVLPRTEAMPTSAPITPEPAAIPAASADDDARTARGSDG